MDIGDILFDEPTIANTVNRYLRRMPYGSKSATGGRYKRRGKVSKRPSPFKRVNTRAMVTRTKTKRLVKLIKSVQLGQSETCYKTTKFAPTPVPVGQNFMTGSVNHNSVSQLSLWYQGSAAFPVQGNSDGERKGDEIYLTGIKVRLVMQVPYDRRNSKFRFYFVMNNPAAGNPDQKSDLFHNSINNVMVDAMQTDRFRIKKLGSARLYSTDQSTTGQDKTIIKTFWLPIKRKITFTGDSTRELAMGLPEEGRILITGYDSITSLETDTLCPYMEAAMTVYYKDP